MPAMIPPRVAIACSTGALLFLVAALGPLRDTESASAPGIELASAGDGALLSACAIGIGEGGAGDWAPIVSQTCAAIALEPRLAPSPAGLEAARAWASGLVRGGHGDPDARSSTLVGAGFRALLVGGEPPADAVGAYAEGVASGLSRAGAHPDPAQILRTLVTLPREADLSVLVGQGERDALGTASAIYAATWS